MSKLIVAVAVIVIAAVAVALIASYSPLFHRTSLLPTNSSITTSTASTTSLAQVNYTGDLGALDTSIAAGSPNNGCNALVKIYLSAGDGPTNDTCMRFVVQLTGITHLADGSTTATFNLYTDGVLTNSSQKIFTYGTSIIDVYGQIVNIYLNSTSSGSTHQYAQIVINVTANATAVPCSNCTGGPTSPYITIALKNYRAPYCQGASQAPIGQNGLPCAAEINSSAKTFTNTSGAFDCAGFVQYVYSQLGIKIPSKAQSQFGNFYPDDAKVVPVPGGQANTVPGDLVYFSIPSDHDPEPAHVAMCYNAGCNTIIQNGGPLPGMPGTIAPLNALLCTNSSANQARCVMGFMQVTGSSIFRANQSAQ